MADYQPLISRAIAGLEQNTGENRRMLYERARAALVAQLRSVDPPLEEADVTRERLALEEAIRKAEAEAAAKVAAPPAPPEPAPSLRDQGLRNFRDTVAEAGDLGAAAAGANRAARTRVMPGDHPPAGRGEPTHYFEPPHQETGTAEAGEPRRSAAPPPPYEEVEEEDYTPPVRSYGRLVKWLVVLVVLGGLAAAGYRQWPFISAKIASWRAATELATKPNEAAPPSAQPKFDERVQPKNAAPTAPATAPAAAVAQKVVLYDEDPANPQGKRYVGSAIWRTETVSPGPGLAPELAIRADVEIPERHMRMTMSIRRNTDKALPASHTMEVMFTLPADFDQGGVGNVPGVLMKANEQARGVPLAGLAVKVTNGYFLIGLSAVDVDLQRNLEMLKGRDWFDIPIVYTSSKRAILALEKGTPGQRAFEEAFRAWGE